MEEVKITKPLDAATRHKLSAAIATQTERVVLRRVGISRPALTRALAGLPVYGGTRIAIEHAMREMAKEEAR
jgi:hypothetical protein